MQMQTIDVPSGLSPKEAKKFVSAKKREFKAKARAKEIAENGMGMAIGAAAAYGYGVIEDKLPNGGMIPGTNIGFDLAGGLALGVGGLLTKGRMSMAMMFAGMGLLFPVLRDYGKAATFF